MFLLCENCETKLFCTEMDRCLDVMIYDGFGDGDPEDREDELTADDHPGIKPIIQHGEVLEKPLKELELEIIKAALR